MKQIVIVEEEPSRIPAAEFEGAAAIALSKSGHFDIAFPSPLNDYHYVVRSKGWVGHIPLGHGLLVVVTPKAPISTLFGMLDVAYGLNKIRIFDEFTNVETLGECYETLASILAKKVLERARRGLYRSYVEHFEDLSSVRGRLDGVITALNVRQGKGLARCRFQDIEADIDDNAILLWTLHQIPLQGGLHQSTRTLVAKAYRALRGEVALQPYLARDCTGRSYHRLNSDYQEMHALCRFFLEQSGPSITVGDRRLVPFAVDMPRLFETCVAESLRMKMPVDVLVRRQQQLRPLSTEKLVFNADIVLSGRKSKLPLAVLDTKYKVGAMPTSDDVAQVVTYAVQLGVKEAFLVYPDAAAAGFAAQVGPVHVRSAVFNTAKHPNYAGAELAADLAEIVIAERTLHLASADAPIRRPPGQMAVNFVT